MERSYDETIARHYQEVAESTGSSPRSTMLDEVIRTRETAAIEAFVRFASERLGDLDFVDVGCGNGFSLEVLAERFPRHDYTGIELTVELRKIAARRLDGAAAIHAGDIRDPDFAQGRHFDALLSQRVLINLLDPDDQRSALENLVNAVKPGGFVLFIEAFRSSLDRLNVARDELDLDPIESAHHNLYLTDGFFDHGSLEPISGAEWGVAMNDLSTHYYISRVFFPWATRHKPLKRNAAFAKFFSAALPPAIGNFAPLQIRLFRRRS